MQGIIDSHAHICGKLLFPRWDAVIERAKKAGVERIMIVCTEVEEAERAIEIPAIRCLTSRAVFTPTIF